MLLLFCKCYEPSVTSKRTVVCQMYVTWMSHDHHITFLITWIVTWLSHDFICDILFNLGCCWHVSEESNIYCFKSVFSTIENQINNSTNHIAEKISKNSDFEIDNRPSPRSEIISLDLEPVRSQSSVDIIEEVIWNFQLFFNASTASSSAFKPWISLTKYLSLEHQTSIWKLLIAEKKLKKSNSQKLQKFISGSILFLSWLVELKSLVNQKSR